MTATLRAISSMATRQVLADLAQAYEQRTGVKLQLESVGGVDAAKRVQAGEAFDAVFLASDALDKLLAAGAATGPRVDVVLSGVAVAVPAHAPRVDIRTEDEVKQAVLAAPTIGYSTGPSGTALMKLFERWGIAEQVHHKLVQAKAGVPVGASVAEGKVDLGFQQLSELLGLPGITVLGQLPRAIAIDTIFSGAVCATSQQQDAVRGLLAFMASPETADTKRRHGMEPA